MIHNWHANCLLKVLQEDDIFIKPPVNKRINLPSSGHKFIFKSFLRFKLRSTRVSDTDVSLQNIAP